ncbi:Feline leukemia virus subgroup C receptor-related protein 2 [Dirofilaria immitis]|nr:Feline leukemia virus subgroup C receptor-related protein 2 [Dirofilaria immitis]
MTESKASVLRETEGEDALKSDEIHLYKRRYYILLVFVLLSASNSMQWIEYSVIAHIIVHFYSVSYVAVDWTSMIYMLTYIIFVLPASWILDKYGLRVSIILGSGGNCIGAWIKMFSTRPDAFWITFLGQTIVGFSQMFILSIPPRLAAVWFGSKQVSTACAIGVFGNQLGIAIGFLLPPVLVHMGATDSIAADLSRLFLISVIVNTIIFLLIIFSVPKKPLLPPSLAQLRMLGDTNEKIITKLSKYFGKLNACPCLGYSLSSFNIIPADDGITGMVGLLLVLAGMVGSILCGFILDRFHEFKFFMAGYLPIGFEFASELTFPIAEGTASGLLNASAQVFGITLTLCVGFILQYDSVFVSNLTLTGFLVVGTFLTALIKSDLRRQRAHENVPYISPPSEPARRQHMVSNYLFCAFDKPNKIPYPMCTENRL